MAQSKKSSEVKLNRRDGDRRKPAERRKQDAPVAAERRQLERRVKVNRRRQIDPTTCERDYTDAEVEFMNALNEYKRTSGRMFPTCSEILEVVTTLGYRKAEPMPAMNGEPCPMPAAEAFLSEPLEGDAAAVDCMPVAL